MVFYDYFFYYFCVLARFVRLTLICFQGEYLIQFNKGDFVKLLFFVQKSSLFKFCTLSDLFAVDYLTKGGFIELNYFLITIAYNVRLRLKCFVYRFIALSVERFYRCAAWFEREIWDMYGIVFLGNKDLRRILTDYGFKGHPMRKDFPLSGFVEIRFSEAVKRIVIEPIELSQKYRYFVFQNPWL